MSNEFDAAVSSSLQPDPAQAARVGFAAAADTNPDAYAEAQRVARRTGVPVDTVFAMPKEMKRQDALGSIDFDTLAKTSPTTAALLADVEKAKISHDDHENLSAIESTLQFVKNTGRAGASGVFGMNAGIVGALQAPFDLAAPVLDPLVGKLLPENPLRRVASGLSGFRREIDTTAKGYMPKGDGVLESGYYSGIGSLARNLLALPLAFLPGGQSAALAAMVAPVGGEEYGKARDKGIAPVESAVYGLSQATIEYATEKLPMSWLLKDLKAGTPFLKTLGHQAISEVPGEQIATALQDMNEWATINPQKSFSDYLAERPNAAAQTLIATLVGVGGQVSVVKSLDSTIALATGRVNKAQEADSTAELLGRLNELAAANKVLQRDPATFEAFVAQAAESGPVQDVFLSAQTLQQSGLAEQLAAVSPAVAEQYASALATGGDLRIPVEEYTARIASTELAQPLFDHLKTEPEGFTRAEAQEYLQSGAAQELQAEVERALEEKDGDESFKASAEVVRSEIRTQLDTAARFTPQVNDAYAAMVGNFYAVTAAKMGTTPEALFQKYPLQIGAESVAGQQFDQGAGETEGGVYTQSKKAKRDDYTLDLFGVPDNSRADTAAGRPAAGRPDGELSRNDAPGTYATRTELVQENTRQLGTDRVTTPQEAAQALAYLAKGAVERFDALVTDKDGKPLAIVGAFKGALTQASVFPSTLAGEAFRINGAANIWFAHNHPSGTNELSNADRAMHSTLAEVFRGSEITSRGLFAIAGKQGDGRNWVFEPTPESRYSPEPDVRGASTAPAATASVPVVERVYTEEGDLGPPITSPTNAKAMAKQLAGDQAGVVLMTAQNKPVAFVPLDSAEVGVLRRSGRMDALYRALSVANAGAAIIVNNGTLGDQMAQNLAGLFNSLDVRVLDVMDTSGDTVQSWAEQGKRFDDRAFNQGARGSFNPATLRLTLLKNADLSTFLHESGHFFLEVQADLAGKVQQEAAIHGADTLTPGEQQILKDMQATLDWFGVRDLGEWNALDFEEKRSYHETFARGFEAYLFEGTAPSIEMQGVFQRFRAWLLNVYKDMKALNVELTDEVRGVFDRMLATTEEIKLAEQGRSMMPLFTSPEQAGMTPAEFADYQALGTDATNEAIQDLQARGLRDMQWLHNARGRIIKRLQKEASAKRAEVRMGVRREVMRQPVYRAWQFLTGKLTADDQIEPAARAKSDPDILDEAQDSLFVAIAKLGGISKDEVVGTWGIDPKDKPTSGLFGKPLWRVEGKGLSIDGMAEALSQRGYLDLDEHGKWDIRELEEKFKAELGGDTQYSTAYDYASQQDPGRAGDQIANPLALSAGRLDRAALTEIGLPAEIIEHLKTLRMTAKDGLHPDLVAELFGFTSGDELVRTLAAAETPKAEIEALTDVRMLERYGDLSSEQAIERAADKAIHNDVRARMIATELNALAKATGKPKTLASAAKGYAAAMVARLKVRHIKPGQYASAEVRASKAAEKASKAGDLATAAAEKRNQLINNYATRAAYDAQEEVDKIVRYLRKFENEGSRKGLDVDYLVQIDGLLERFDLRKGQSLKAIDKRESLAKWIEAQESAGLEPDLPDWLTLESNKTHYKNLTVEELRGLHDAVRQIEHLGRLKKKLLTARDARELDAIVREIADSMIANAGGRIVDNEARNELGSKFKQFGRWAMAAHRKSASVVREMDGFKDGGPMWEYFIRSMNEAGEREATMRADAAERLHALAKPVLANGKLGGKGKHFPTLDRSLNRGEILAMALNIGNESNLQRLLGGKGWTEGQIKPALDTLTATDWAFVQGVWDFFESYRPQIAAKQMRIYGNEPDWIAPGNLLLARIADEQGMPLRGGYYPVKYDPRQSGKAAEFDDAESAKAMMRAAHTASTTRRSFTKTRAEEVVGRPLLLTFDGIWQGANEVIHDLTWHEWLIDANRLLRRLDGPMRDHYGAQHVDALRKAVKDTARGDMPAANNLERSLNHLRTGSTVVGLGWNLTTALLQPLGITQSMVRVGPAWIARGLRDFYTHPVEKAAEVQEKSEFMRNRGRTFMREINDVRNQLESDKGEVRSAVEASFFVLIQKLQATVDYPTWLGAYEKAVAGGNDEARAIALADQAVIDAQGGGQIKDLAEVQRGHPAMKLFTNFYSFFNVALNLAVERTKATDFKKPGNVAALAGDYVLLLVLPSALGALLKSVLKGGDDDEDKLLKKVVEEQIGFLLGLFVGLRETTTAVQLATGVGNPGLGYGGPAGVRFFAELQKLGQQIGQGEADMALFKAANSVAGILFHYPAGQVNRLVEGMAALLDGRTNNPLAPLVGPPPKN